MSVEVWDPSSEGPWIVGQLRQAGFEVRAVAAADVPRTRARLLLMAGDAPEGLGPLKLLRDEGEHGDVPVVLLGTPPGTEPPNTGEGAEGPGFGADAVFARPVSFEPLLACVRRLLSATEPPEISRVNAPPVERTMQLSSDDPDSSQVLVRTPPPDEASHLPSWRPREPTMQLDDEASDAGEEVSMVTRGPSGSESGADTSYPGASTPASRPGTGPAVGTDAPQPEIPPERRAKLSPWLEELLVAADRRAFPDRPPLALHFPAADEPPEVLVPPELFDTASIRLDEPVVEDPIDAFTFVGGPAVPPPVHPSSAGHSDAPTTEGGPSGDRASTAAETPSRRHEQTTATELPGTPGSGVHRASAYPVPPPAAAEWPEDDTVLGAPTPDGGRRGALGPGGALRLLWRVTTLGLDAICELTAEGGATVRMTFLAGELRALEGPVAARVVDGLRRRGRATEQPADEAGAEAVLQRRVEEGELGRFERDRLLREARESLLLELVAAERAEFALRRLEDTEPGRVLSRARVFSRPLRAALVEAARRALSEARVRALLGDEPRGLALSPEREAALIPAELPSELLELLVRMDGRGFDEILAAAPTEPGLAGVLYALVAADALVPVEAPPDARPPETERAAVHALVRAAAELALDADYFAVLGLSRNATGADVARAHHARRNELSSLPLSALGLDALEAARAEAIDAVDEAHRVLSDGRLRRAYAAAL
ncbi:MAG TPA: hypothetical protein RMH99_18005 [Sandaracinaceae bacterium LLY-WYZ-13_1]|nr:hypothetical protein [Sandaracinaceae bacterium LLY-WYZ-13_1]